MSIFAFCASRVSWISTGSARALICWSLPLLSGYSTTETSVIVPFATVSSTCTGPQRVEASSPVTVDDAVEVPVPESDDVESDEVESDDVEPDDAPVEPVSELPWTGATTEESAVAVAWDDVEVW